MNFKSLGVFFRGESAHDVQMVVARPKQAVCIFRIFLIGVVVSHDHRIIVLAQYYEFRVISIIFGRTDLRKGESGAKFDAESDFEVHLAIALQKPD